MYSVRSCLLVLVIAVTVTEIRSAWNKEQMLDGRFMHGLTLAPVRLGEKSARDGVTTEWFEQKLDHFDEAETRTWKQKYMTNSKYYKEGGPVFLMFGGEGPIGTGMIETDDGVVKMAWMDSAIKQGAMAFQLEHRYYGDSLPVENAFTTEGLKYLSSRQALHDAANFIRVMNKRYGFTSAQKWIVFGGSYAGNLAGWMREQHPDLVAGAIASSAPLKAELDYKEYLQVVGTDLRNVSQECYDTTVKIFEKVYDLAKTPVGRAFLQRKLNICGPINVKDDDSRGVFYDTLYSPFMTVAQYGGDNVVRYMDMTVQKLCSTLTSNPGMPLFDRLIAVNKMIDRTFGLQCSDVKWDDYLVELDKNNKYKPWFYQKCTEFGYFKTTEGPNQPFGTNTVTLKFRIDPCKSLFGIDEATIRKNVDDTNAYYGGVKGYNATNVVMVNGSQDPWHALGMYYIAEIRPNFDVVYVTGTAHCADMYPASETDSESLKKARQLVADRIGKWVSE